jgi:acyl-coenzyme A thioesterase PaaI-like protein
MSPHTATMAVAEGELVRITKSMFFCQAKLLDPENKRLCATATGTYKRQARAPLKRKSSKDSA